MPAEPFYVELMRIFPDYQTPVVIAALRQEPLIWGSLEDADLFSAVLAAAGDRVKQWNPAAIALLSLGLNIPVETLRSTPLQPLDAEIRQRAARAYETTYLKGLPPATLGEAGLLALALRERRRLTNTWHGLWNELNLQSPNPRYSLSSVWRTPLACLFAMAPDPFEMLTALLPANRNPVDLDWTELVIHPILSNPLSVEEQADLLSRLSAKLTPEDRTVWVEWLQKAGRDQLAAVFADRCATSFTNSAANASSNARGKALFDAVGFSNLSGGSSPYTLRSSMDEVQANYQMASYHQAAGNPGLAITYFDRVVNVLRKLQAAVSNQLAEAADMDNDPAAGIEARQVAINLVPDFHEARANLARSFMKTGQAEAAQKVLNGETEHPEILLAKARLALNHGNPSEAQGFARQAYEHIKANRSVDDSTASWRKIRPAEFIRTLLDVQLVSETSEMAAEILRYRPVDCEMLESICRASLAKGLPAEAAQMARLAISLKPRDPHLRRLLADTYEQVNDWDGAFPERKAIVEMSPQPATADLLNLAKCALECRIPDQASDSCQQILKQSPEHGMAHVYLGEAEWQKGDKRAAVEHFTRATVTTPDMAEGWLALARIQEAGGDHIKSVETLRTGMQAAPDSGKIYYAMAESCLASGAPSEALPALRKAVSLDPKSPEISLKLGEILLSLGHLDEARTIFEKARLYSPVHPDLAYVHGKTLLACGEIEKAITVLAVKLAAKPTVIEPYLLYARLVADAHSRETAHRFVSGQEPKASSTRDGNLAGLENTLHAAIQNQPDHIEASILLAETYFQAGKVRQAYELFDRLCGKGFDPSNPFYWRIKLGYGRAAMALGEKEAGLAALVDASLAHPDDHLVQQSLAEGYLHSNHPQESLEVGRLAVRLRPDNVHILVWFACLAHNLGLSAESIASLERTLELDPENPALRMRLAQLHTLDKNPSEARAMLKSIRLGEGDEHEPVFWKQLADLWMGLDDYPAAAECLEKATREPKSTSAGLWYQLARIYRKNADPQAALDAIHQALDLQPNDPDYHFFQSEVFSQVDEIQSALECLDHALQLPVLAAKEVPTIPSQLGMLAFPAIEEPGGKTIPLEPADVYARMAGLLRKQGDLSSAIVQAEKAIDQNPSDIRYRAMAADLAFANLDYPRAITYIMAEVEEPRDDEEDGEPAGGKPVFDPTVLTPSQIPAAVQRFCILAEINMEEGRLDEARQALEQASRISASSPRMMAAEARLKAIQGDFQTAEGLLEKAIIGLNRPDPISEASVHGNQPEGTSGSQAVDETIEYPAISIAQAALGLFQWNVALPLFEQAARQAPNEPKPQLWLARALAYAGECLPVLKTLDVVSHTPASFQDNPDSQSNLFEKAIQAASQLSQHRDISGWTTRGKAAFGLEPGGEPVGTGAEADFDLLPFQQAIRLIDEDPGAAFGYAQSLVEQKRGHPLALACFACAADHVREYPSALVALEGALAIWPGEPVWHAAAARLNQSAGSPKARIEHLENARQIDPEQIEYTLSLAKAYSDQARMQDAFKMYEQARDENPGSVEAWMGMAESSRSMADISKAMAYGEKAITLAPDQVQPHILCSEIALQSGQIELAQRHAETALSLRSNDSQAVLMIIRVMAAQGLSADALEALELSIPTVSDPYALKLERIQFVRALHGLEPAIAALSGLVIEYPQDLQVLKLLAETLSEAGRNEDAERFAYKALQLDPRQVSLHFLVGKLQRKTGHLDQAIHHFSEAIRLSPDHLDATLELASTHADRREYKQALEMYDLAAKIAPRDPRSYHQAANALKEIKDYTGAEARLRRAAELAPEDVAIRRQLGAIIALNLVHRQQEALQ
jgi:tetratricopeptide (TPR) repeat protein